MKITILSLLFSMSLFASFSQKQMDSVMDDIDNLCMDTYCGGDFNFYNPTLSYDESTNLYTINFYAVDWYEGTFLGIAIEEEISFPLVMAYTPDYSGYSIENSTVLTVKGVELGKDYWNKEAKAPIVNFTCQFELKNNTSNFDRFFQDVDMVNTDCIFAFERLFAKEYLHY